MGSTPQENCAKPQSPDINATEDESEGSVLPNDGADASPPKKHQSVAIGLARNGMAALVLIVLVVFGAVSVSRNSSAKSMEQVVNLGDTMDQNYPSGTSNKSPSSSRHDHTLLHKARARHHRRIKSQSHPDKIAHASTRRLMMGMGMGMGMGGGSSRSGSGRSGRTFMPTPQPSASPSASPTIITPSPSSSPTIRTPAPSVSNPPSQRPSISPTNFPTVSAAPSVSKQPSEAPSVSKEPSMTPSISPSGAPSVSDPPSLVPTERIEPSASPSIQPTFVRRTFPPTVAPTDGPGGRPSFGSSRSRSRSGGMMGMGRGRGRAFEIDDDRFDEQLNDLLRFLPADFVALFANGNN